MLSSEMKLHPVGEIEQDIMSDLLSLFPSNDAYKMFLMLTIIINDPAIGQKFTRNVEMWYTSI